MTGREQEPGTGYDGISIHHFDKNKKLLGKFIHSHLWHELFLGTNAIAIYHVKPHSISDSPQISLP